MGFFNQIFMKNRLQRLFGDQRFFFVCRYVRHIIP